MYKYTFIIIVQLTDKKQILNAQPDEPLITPTPYIHSTLCDNILKTNTIFILIYILQFIFEIYLNNKKSENKYQKY
jgi:hypothetical protein